MTSHDTIRAALEAASTPWQSIPTSLDDERRVLQEWGGDLARGCSCDYTTMDAADAHLVSNAPEWLAELLAEVDEAQAEAMYVGHDYDRRGERLWRLAALAGWTPGNEADNDATAELYVRERLAEVDALTTRAEAAEQAIQRVRAMPATPPSGGYYMVSMREVLRALDGGEQ